MAVSSIVVPPDAKRDTRALALVESVPTWPLFTLKQPFGSFEIGAVFRRATGSQGERYLVNAVACECADYRQSHNICKHVRAVVLWEARQTQRAPTAPRPRVSYADLFPACPCGDVAETRDGYCDRCASDREWQQRQSARQAS